MSVRRIMEGACIPASTPSAATPVHVATALFCTKTNMIAKKVSCMRLFLISLWFETNVFEIKLFSAGCEHVITSHTGDLFSPNWPNKYPSRKNCYWQITTAVGHRVKVVSGVEVIDKFRHFIYQLTAIHLISF